MSERKGILMICLGNICRSPIAEAVMIDVVKKQNVAGKFHIDSAAIGRLTCSFQNKPKFIGSLTVLGPWHAGKSPDHRALETMKNHDLVYSNKARQITPQDFKKFDYIFGMDDENMSELEDLKPKDGTAKLLLLGDFDPQGDRIIRDPYYDRDAKGFEKAYIQSVRCCEAFLTQAIAGEV